MSAVNYQMENCLKNSMECQTEGLSTDDSSVNELGTDNYEVPHKAVPYHASDDASLFSSLLPVLPDAKLNLSDSELFGYSVDDELTSLSKVDCNDGLTDAELESDEIGIMLPHDEEELLAGIMDDFDLRGLSNQVEDFEEYDLFGSGGGLEMDFDPQESVSVSMSKPGLSDGMSLNGVSHFGISNGMGTVAGEHPYGEHPSRTLFVRNINSNVEDSELRTLFEQYGDIRALYTACKHRGFVMISYYDIRAARTAMRTLQNKPLRRRKLDIHFSIPKDNPSEKDINQGTLVVFNLDASVTNDDLRCIFGAYGEVKEIRETPHKRHHKFIEFYDVRSAEAALKALNRSDIAGKRIKLEPSRPGGARRNLIQHMSHELEQDEVHNLHHHIGSPITNSAPGNWSHFDSPPDQSPLQTYHQSGGLRPVNGTSLPGLGSILPPYLPSPGKISPIGKDQGHDSNFPYGYHKISSSVGLLHNGNYLMNMRMAPLARHGPSCLGNHVYQNTSFMESLVSARRQVEDKKQYHLDLEKIVSGEDSRTTLMIKNIPNKYTSNMLLATMEENHRGTFDFLYLPIDFKNKCNVGYAFINMVSPTYIIPFYEALNGKKWEKFNSEKVASLAYARIQGKTALVTHFQNSSLMNEDKGCRPIVFPSDGDQVSDEELKSKLSLDEK